MIALLLSLCSYPFAYRVVCVFAFNTNLSMLSLLALSFIHFYPGSCMRN